MASREGDKTSPRSSAGSVNAWLVAILLIVVAVMWFQHMGWFPSPLFNPNAQPRPITARGDLAEDEKSTIELFRQASPSVAHITSTTVRIDRVNLNPFEIPLGTGSGFLWDEDGHIVTNYHVVKGANRLLVTLGNKPQMEARFVGAEPEKDLAVLKIDALRGTLRPLPIGTSADLLVGQKVFAIGNPFGLDQTLTTGVISGLGREIDPSAERGDGEAKSSRKIQDVIQIDAAINPGNSGGPLLDSAGRLIGINTAIISPSGVYAGIGFAVPVDTVNFVVPQIIRSGRADRPALGVTILPDSVTERLRQGGLLNSEGVLVSDVVGQSAVAAGIRPTRRSRDGKTSMGDLITAIDGQPVKDTPGLFKIIEKCHVGQSVSVTLQRDGTELKVPLVLQERPRVSE